MEAGFQCVRHARCAASPARHTSSTRQMRAVATAYRAWTSMSGHVRDLATATLRGRARFSFIGPPILPFRRVGDTITHSGINSMG